MENTLLSLQKQQLITLQDAAIVTWPQGKKQPKTQQLHSLAGAGAMQGAFWGMLFGLIFFVPFFGLAVGAAMGALSGKFADYGIDDNFIKQMQDKVTEGTSALFLLTSGATVWRRPSRVSTSRSSRPTCPKKKRINCAPPSAQNSSQSSLKIKENQHDTANGNSRTTFRCNDPGDRSGHPDPGRGTPCGTRILPMSSARSPTAVQFVVRLPFI
jgi:hypothetical protein